MKILKRKTGRVDLEHGESEVLVGQPNGHRPLGKAGGEGLVGRSRAGVWEAPLRSGGPLQ